MNSLNRDIIFKISEFCYFEDIISLYKLNQYFSLVLHKYKVYKTIEYNKNTELSNIIFNEIDKSRFHRLNRSARCPTCGALFKNFWGLKYYHFSVFPHHNKSREYLQICISNSLHRLYFKIPSFKEYFCIYGICDCPSVKHNFMDEVEEDDIVNIKFITEFGHFSIYNIRQTEFVQYLGILKFYDFHNKTYSRNTFRILYFRNHYWLQLYPEHMNIISIYDIKISKKESVLIDCMIMFLFLLFVGILYIMILSVTNKNHSN